MIRRSDGPKTYWGYYQDYLVQIYEKKSKKNWPRFSAKNPKFPKAIVWRKKLGEMATAGDVQILASNWMYTSSIICWRQYGQLLSPNLPENWW